MLSKNLLYTARHERNLCDIDWFKANAEYNGEEGRRCKTRNRIKEQIQSAIEYYENGNTAVFRRAVTDGDLWAMLELESSVFPTYPRETKGSDQESHDFK